MTENKKRSNTEANKAIALLANLAMIQYQKKFNIKQGSEQIIALLQWATSSDREDVNALLCNCGEAMPSAHRRFFESNNIRFDPLTAPSTQAREMTYRGKKVLKETHSTKADSAPDNEANNKQKGKRKITYRGQEKWV